MRPKLLYHSSSRHLSVFSLFSLSSPGKRYYRYCSLIYSSVVLSLYTCIIAAAALLVKLRVRTGHDASKIIESLLLWRPLRQIH